MPHSKNSIEIINNEKNPSIKGFIYNYGTRNVILTAPHAQGPSSDLFTGEIAYRVGEKTGAHIFISTISREKLDLNYPSKHARLSQFRIKLQNLVKTLIKEHKNVLVLDIHGMDREDGPDIFVGTLSESTARIEAIHLIMNEFEKEGLEAWLAEFFEPSLIGGDIIASLGHLDEAIDAIQIEINQNHRHIGDTHILTALVNIINHWLKLHRPIWGTGAILKKIAGSKFPIKAKQDLLRSLGGGDTLIQWAKGKHRKVDEIIATIEDKWFPIMNSKELIRVIKKPRMQ